MVQQIRKSITALAFFLMAGLAWGQPSQGQGPLAIKLAAVASLRRGSGRHALGHFPALYRFSMALARALEHEQGADTQSPSYLSGLRDYP